MSQMISYSVATFIDLWMVYVANSDAYYWVVT